MRSKDYVVHIALQPSAQPPTQLAAQSQSLLQTPVHRALPSESDVLGLQRGASPLTASGSA